MCAVSTPAAAPSRAPERLRRGRASSLEVFCAVLVAAVLLRGPLTDLLDAPGVRTGATVFVAVCVQAMPFLVFGVLVSGLIAAFVPASAFRRVLPARPAAAVPVAGAAGMVLPGCECASVPVARRLMQQGWRLRRRWRSCWPRPR